MSAAPALQRADSVAARKRGRRLLRSRGALALVAAVQAEIGVWGVLAPHSFYSGFPGAGQHWVSVLGPYDEHLVRDFAAGELGLMVVLACAAVWFERRLVLVASAAFLAAELPHFVYHLTTTDSVSTTANLASLGGFILQFLLVGAAAIGVVRKPRRPERST